MRVTKALTAGEVRALMEAAGHIPPTAIEPNVQFVDGNGDPDGEELEDERYVLTVVYEEEVTIYEGDDPDPDPDEDDDEDDED